MATQTTTRPGRKAVKDPKNPHGLGPDGKPLAPHGYLGNGNPRVYPKTEVDMDAVSLDILAAPEAVPTDLVKKSAPARTRDDKQLKMDEVVKKLHADWIRAGKPAQWDAMPKVMYPVPKPGVQAIHKLADRAADLHGVAIKYGTVFSIAREVNGKQLQLVAVSFAVRDKRERASQKTNSRNGANPR